MDVLKNIGISYNGDYILQGSKVDICKKSNKLDINNIELVVSNDLKDIDFISFSKYYHNNIIIHLPTININQTNLKNIKEIVSDIKKTNISLVTINASSLLSDAYEWGVVEEQQNYIKNISSGLASLASLGINIGIENVSYYKDDLLFGNSISSIKDILIQAKKILVNDYEISSEDANKIIGISLNIENLNKTNQLNKINDWINVFKNDIKCIKIDNYENNIISFNELLDLIISNNIDKPVLLNYSNELEEVNDYYSRFKHIINNKVNNMPLNFDNYKKVLGSKEKRVLELKVSQAGFANFTIMVIIVLTIICAVLMLMIHFR